MRLSIDRDRCQSHNRCVAEAPDLVDVDDQLKAVIIVDTVDAGQEESALAVVRNCPERAITVSHD